MLGEGVVWHARHFSNFKRICLTILNKMCIKSAHLRECGRLE